MYFKIEFELTGTAESDKQRENLLSAVSKIAENMETTLRAEDCGNVTVSTSINTTRNVVSGKDVGQMDLKSFQEIDDTEVHSDVSQEIETHELDEQSEEETVSEEEPAEEPEPEPEPVVAPKIKRPRWSEEENLWLMGECEAHLKYTKKTTFDKDELLDTQLELEEKFGVRRTTSSISNRRETLRRKSLESGHKYFGKMPEHDKRRINR